MSDPDSDPDPELYTIGWICALETEYVAAQEMLDEEHAQLATQHANDNNIYTLGRIGKHNVVIACLPLESYGLVSAANAARDMLRTFQNIKFGLMVGIGGGVPTKQDVRLGDVVVSAVDGENGAVFQFDHGKTIQGQAFQTTGHLDAPPPLLRSAVHNLKTRHRRRGNDIDSQVSAALKQNPRLQDEYQRPDATSDKLYHSDFPHQEGGIDCAASCGIGEENLVKREPRSKYDHESMVHYGLIASSDQLMKDAQIRDELAREKGVLCFETEAAGLMNHFKCLVIRGICDYADTHKNDLWQGYAAMAAAAYAKDLLNTIPPSKVQVERQVILDMCNTTQEVRSIAKKIVSEKRSADISKWLSPPDPSTNHAQAVKQHYGTTGQWFLNNKTYSLWKEGPGSFLWLNGKPGCGKTILSSTVIENLKQTGTKKSTLLYFYFDFNDAKKQSFESMIRSLIIQLYLQTLDAQVSLDQLYELYAEGKTSERGRSQPLTESLVSTLQTMVSLAGEVHIVIDALDECSTHQELLDWVRSTHETSSGVHLLTASRPEQQIEASIRKWACSDDTISLQSQVVDADIYDFIHAKVHEDISLQRWRNRPEVQNEIISALKEKADGMFRWVTCQLYALSSCKDYRALKKTLNSLPRTLDETYNRIIKNIPSDELPQTIRILQFSAFSEWSLNIDMFVDLIAVDLDERPRFDPRFRMADTSEISQYCSSLVQVVIDDSGRSYLKLSHSSVKDWLLSNRFDVGLAENFRFSNAHGAIAQVCLAYLIDIIRDNDRYSLTCGNYSFLIFASRRWVRHATACQETTDQVAALVVELLSSEGAEQLVRRWSYDPLPHPHTYPLCIASFYGMHKVITQLLDKGFDVNHCDLGGSALSAASLGGHVAVVKHLLDRGAHVCPLSEEENRNALCSAAKGGSEESLALILDKCRIMKEKSKYLGIALQRALHFYQPGTARLLVENGADPNVRTELGSAINFAVNYSSFKHMLKLLLASGADIQVEDANGHTPLQSASRIGYTDAVKLLLGYGADINYHRKKWMSALDLALLRGHENTAKLLIDNGANLSFAATASWGSLEYAAKRCSEDTVRLILDRGDCDADPSLQAALLLASEGGNDGVVELLVDRGAHINGGYDRNKRDEIVSPLYKATYRNHESTVRLLLGRGADANLLGGRHGSVLQAASYYGQFRVTQALLDGGADVNMPGGEHGSALQAASHTNQEAIVELLLNRGANVNMIGGKHGSALQAASHRGYKSIAEHLLNRGADVNLPGGKYVNALQAAEAEGHILIAKLLREKGAVPTG